MKSIGSSTRSKQRLLGSVVALGAALVLCISFGTALAAAGRSAAGAAPAQISYTVNSTLDEPDAAPGDGLCQGAGAARGACTLRAALEEANVAAAPVVIQFNVGQPATITLATPLLVANSVTIQGPGARWLSLEGLKVTRHFDIAPSVSGSIAVSITGLSLVNGSSATDGGSVIVHYSPAGTNVSFDGVVFQGNVASGRGGAVFSDAREVRVIDSLFTGNQAASGGAIANVGGALRVDRSTLAGNEAMNGGALFNSDFGLAGRHGVVTVTVSTLADNAAQALGGALYNESQGGFGAATWVRGSTVVRNSVPNALYGAAGGGIFNGDKSTVVLNNTILAANTSGSAATPAWDDCLSLSGGVAGMAGVSVAVPDSYLTGGDNLVGAGTSNGCPAAPGDIQYDPARLFIDVLSDQLRSYDGSQPMFALLPNSPAIDQTQAGSQLCGTALTVDERGAPKPLGPACDIGAYEAALPAISVARTLSVYPGSCTSQASVELATGAVVYSCATVTNTGNVAFTRTVISAPGSSFPFTLTQPLLPGQAMTLTASELPALAPKRVNGDSPGTLNGEGVSQWSTPPGTNQQVAGRALSLARPVDVAMRVTGKPFGFGAIRTVTATVTYHQDNVPVPQRLVQLTVSGGTNLQLPAQTTNALGQATFTYISISPLTPATAVSGGRSNALTAATAAPEATDFLQIWVDLNGNGVRDSFEPYTAAGLPTAVTLASFEAQAAAGNGVLLRWRTASELNLVSFYLLRATQAAGAYEKITVVPSQGSAGLGSEYSYTDYPAAPGTYYYKLEEVGMDGGTIMHGPVSVQVSGPSETQRLFLPVVFK